MAAAALVLGLAACGDDGNSGSDSAQAPENGASETPLSDEQLGKNAQKGGDGSGADGGSKTGEEDLNLENSEPAPPISDNQRKRQRDLPRTPTPKADLKPAKQQVYEASLFFCKQTGIDGMRQEYGIESSDPKVIAREAARRTYTRGDTDAVYSGCLAGLTGK